MEPVGIASVPAINRREVLAALLGSSSLLLPGCSGKKLPPAGELLSPSLAIGHRIRDGFRPQPPDSAWEHTGVVIVGGGIAGLSAGWRLQHAGQDDYLLLELEPQPGGTSLSGESAVTAYPWGAHYVPLPLPTNRALLRLLNELGAVDAGPDSAKAGDGHLRGAEHVLCREPHERLFVHGQWNAGLYPHRGASREDLRQWDAFQTEIHRWIDWRDDAGRRAFTIPQADCSDAPQAIALDTISMADWLQQHGWNSERLRWLVDYCCRDDYGLTLEQTSAWAGLFYFASRVENSQAASQPLLTWPAGNGRIVQHLAQAIGPKLRSGQVVLSIEPEGPDVSQGARVVVLDVASERVYGIQADQVIFAAPQFLAGRLIHGWPALRQRQSSSFQYGAWVSANLHLSARPRESGFPLAWDNVLYESPSLGYVVATHQSGIDHGPSVWTWYMPLCDALPAKARTRLLELPWDYWAEFVLADLEVAHPEIRDVVQRLDVMRWGHAMIQPRPGFLWGQARRKAAKPFGPVHFANTDLSGLALMEEAFYHGLRASEAVLAVRNTSFTSFL